MRSMALVLSVLALFIAGSSDPTIWSIILGIMGFIGAFISVRGNTVIRNL